MGYLSNTLVSVEAILTKAGRVVHEEHNTIDLPVGKYAVIRQREYVSSDMTKIVRD